MTAWPRRVRIALVLLGVVAALTVSAAWWLPALLIAPSDEGSADAGVLLVGDTPSEPARDLALSLFRSAKIHSVVCASRPLFVGLYQADAVCRQLGELGVPDDRRFIVHLPLFECSREMFPTLLAVARGQGWTSMLIVASPEESRALGRVAVRDFARADIQASVAYADRDRADLVSQWWLTHRKAQRIVGAALGSGLDLMYSQCR